MTSLHFILFRNPCGDHLISRIALLFLCSLIASSSEAQTNSKDTVFFDKQWQTCQRANASYFRTISSSDKQLYAVRDYYMSGQLQMEGSISSVTPEIREGDFIFYDKLGGIESKEA